MKVRILPRVPIWKAGRYKLAAPVSKTGSASPRSERYRRLPPVFQQRPAQAASRSSKAEPPPDKRKTAEHYRAGRPLSNINERKSNEACSPLPKPIALSQELQTGSLDPNPAGRKDDQSFSSDAC